MWNTYRTLVVKKNSNFEPECYLEEMRNQRQIPPSPTTLPRNPGFVLDLNDELDPEIAGGCEDSCRSLIPADSRLFVEGEAMFSAESDNSVPCITNDAISGHESGSRNETDDGSGLDKDDGRSCSCGFGRRIAVSYVLCGKVRVKWLSRDAVGEEMRFGGAYG